MKNILIYLLVLSVILSVSDLQAQCIDQSLIDPSGTCSMAYIPVCGCDGRTYQNSCIATIEGGVNDYTQGPCPIQESYVICPGDNVQIGFPGGIGNALPSWSPSNTLSCTNCFNAIAAPAYTTIYELTILSTMNLDPVTLTIIPEYTYYEVNVDPLCDCDRGEVRLPYYLYTEGTADEPQSYASAFYSWNVNWPDEWCEFYWEFGNGVTSTDPNPQEISFPVIQNTIQLTEPYNICLTISDCDGNVVNDCCRKFYPEGFPTCLLPPEYGACDGICNGWYYNSTIQNCLEFEYGCCAGNANNFDTYEMCISACNQPAVCSLSKDTGPCDGICPRWYYDTITQYCLPFQYGCCGGNANNFTSFEACMDICGGIGCPDILDLESISLNTAEYQANQQLIYGGNISPNQQVGFKAGNRITIQSGFSLSDNSEFKAYISSCD